MPIAGRRQQGPSGIPSGTGRPPPASPSPMPSRSPWPTRTTSCKFRPSRCRSSSATTAQHGDRCDPPGALALGVVATASLTSGGRRGGRARPDRRWTRQPNPPRPAPPNDAILRTTPQSETPAGPAGGHQNGHSERVSVRPLRHHVRMDTESAYEQWSKDADVLARVGRALFPQETRISVRLPASLADAAIAAWHQDGPETLPEHETPEQWRVRDRAATLSSSVCPSK